MTGLLNECCSASLETSDAPVVQIDLVEARVAWPLRLWMMSRYRQPGEHGVKVKLDFLWEPAGFAARPSAIYDFGFRVLGRC